MVYIQNEICKYYLIVLMGKIITGYGQKFGPLGALSDVC